MANTQKEAQAIAQERKRLLELSLELTNKSIHDSDDNELLKKLTLAQIQSQRHLKSIDNNVKFFFYIFFIGLIIVVIGALINGR